MGRDTPETTRGLGPPKRNGGLFVDLITSAGRVPRHHAGLTGEDRGETGLTAARPAEVVREKLLW
jgi:hypothetical protein